MIEFFSVLVLDSSVVRAPARKAGDLSSSSGPRLSFSRYLCWIALWLEHQHVKLEARVQDPIHERIFVGTCPG